MTTISWLMLFRKIIAVYYENHTKPINTLSGQNAELLMLKLVLKGLKGGDSSGAITWMGEIMALLSRRPMSVVINLRVP
jgi:hypothetical protein